MSITATARTAARAGFRAAGDALKKCRLQLQPDVGTYDPVTDTTPTVWAFDQADIDALAYDLTDKQGPGAEPDGREKAFLFLGEDMLADDDVTIVEGRQAGEITDHRGVLWQVIDVETDPTETVWIFNCRR